MTTESYMFFDDCTGLTFTGVQTGKIKVGDAVDGLTDTVEIDLTITSSTVALTSGAISALSGASGLCDIATWNADEAQEILGSSETRCADDLFSAEVKSKLYQIVQISSTSLTLGADGVGGRSGFSEDARPNTLDTAGVMTKQ